MSKSPRETKPSTVAPRQDGFPNPGIPPHHPRRGDLDPAAARRSERQVAVFFLLSLLGTVFFIVSYFLFTPIGTNVAAEPGSVAAIRISTLCIGIGLFASVFFIGIASVHWGKTLMPITERSEERHPMKSSPETDAAATKMLTDGFEESQIARRPLIKWTGLGALAALPIAVLFPLGTLGPLPHDKLKHTFWDQGMKLMRDPSGTPIKAVDVTIGSIFHVMPEGLDEETPNYKEERAKAATIIVRVDPDDLPEDEKKQWTHEGIMAFSKICTHVGCPVALYEQQTHHLLCPCHQSTFDVTQYAKVIFGPAHRPLPQLPISVDSEGYLVASSDYTDPVGPTFWEINH